MIVLKILKIILFAALGLLALVILLLCAPVVVLMTYGSAGGECTLTVRYLLIPLRILPKDEQSVLYKLEKLSAERKEKKFFAKIRLRNFMLQRKATRGIYRFFERQREKARQKKLERKRKKLKAKKKPQTASKEKKEKGAFGKLLEQRGIGGMISWMLEFARIAGSMLGKTFRGVIIRRLDLLMDIGGEDAAQTAINYGRMCAVLLPALSLILNGVRRYHRRIKLQPDFDRENTAVTLDTELVIIPIAVVGHALMAVLKIIAGEVKRQIKEKIDSAAAEGGQRTAESGK